MSQPSNFSKKSFREAQECLSYREQAAPRAGLCINIIFFVFFLFFFIFLAPNFNFEIIFESFSIADFFRNWMTRLTIYQIKALVLISFLRPKSTFYDDPLQFVALVNAPPT